MSGKSGERDESSDERKNGDSRDPLLHVWVSVRGARRRPRLITAR